MLRWRRFVRILLGLFVLLHALAHAVLPMRGALEYPPATFAAAVALVTHSVALVTLFAGGMGLLGSRIFRPHTARLVGIGVVSSVVALLLSWDPSAWWGLALDAVLVGAFSAARNAGVIAPRGRRTPAVGLRRVGGLLAEAVACGLVVYIAVGTVLWPWHRRWGTMPADAQLQWPGDAAGRNPSHELMHAVTIEAPPEAVWPWLVQLGQDRAGFYSYDWLERLFLADVHNVLEIRPDWQHRARGDFVRAAPPNYLGGLFGKDVGWRIGHLETQRVLVLENWGAFVLEPVGPNRTRFIIRSTFGGPDTPAWGAALTFALFELPHFIMERKMMLTIKALAERGVGETS